MRDVIGEICAAVPGPVSAEVTGTDAATVLSEAAVLSAIAPNVAIKVPLTPEGSRKTRTLDRRISAVGSKPSTVCARMPLWFCPAASPGASLLLLLQRLPIELQPMIHQLVAEARGDCVLQFFKLRLEEFDDSPGF